MHLVYSVMSIYDYMIARIPQGRLRFARMLRQIANLLFYGRKHFLHAVWRTLPLQTANCLNGFSHKCYTINSKNHIARAYKNMWWCFQSNAFSAKAGRYNRDLDAYKGHIHTY